MAENDNNNCNRNNNNNSSDSTESQIPIKTIHKYSVVCRAQRCMASILGMSALFPGNNNLSMFTFSFLYLLDLLPFKAQWSSIYPDEEVTDSYKHCFTVECWRNSHRAKVSYVLIDLIVASVKSCRVKDLTQFNPKLIMQIFPTIQDKNDWVM